VSAQTHILREACETMLAERDIRDRSEFSTVQGSLAAADDCQPPITTSLCLSAKQRLVEKIVQSSSQLTDAEGENLSAEIASYLSCTPTSSEADDALLFWKSRAPYYPTLHRLARRFLTLSASSVPVESMFSTTGLTINSKCMSLAPHKLNYCTFIHDNAR
jgi:hypothetical protein